MLEEEESKLYFIRTIVHIAGTLNTVDETVNILLRESPVEGRCVLLSKYKNKMDSRWQIEWHMDNSLLKEINNFCEPFLQTRFVRRRIAKNVKQRNIDLSNDQIWRALVTCLLTSSQRSGPGKPVNRFLLLKTFPLELSACLNNQHRLDEFASQILTKNGIWRANDIGKQLKMNLEKWQQANWSIVDTLSEYKSHTDDPQWERKVATSLQDKLQSTKLHGIGPKQSRNFIQILGLSKFEIPIDSTLAYWFNQWRFPVFLTPHSLNDRYFYEFVNDGIIQLSAKLDMYPCVLDACIFTSEYGDDWPQDSIVF